MKWRLPIVAVLGVFFGLSLGHDSEKTSQSGDVISWLGLGISKVHARGRAHARRGVRRTARRTTRRTTRRVVRRRSIAGCSPWNAYYSCGGVYYRPIVENGVTVYVVVNP